MNTLYNKALMYHNIHNCKKTIIATSLLFSLICYMVSNSAIYNVKNNIGSLISNKIEIDYVALMFFIGLFLGIIYVSIKGLKKNTTIEFFMTGPFNKHIIQINEILCLCIALGIFLFIYSYFFICQYLRNMELFKLIDNFNNLFLWDLFRLFLFGLIFILYLKLIDLLYCNITLSVIAMIFVPIMILINIVMYGGAFIELFDINSKSYEWLYYQFINSSSFMSNNYYFEGNYKLMPIILWVLFGVVLAVSIHFTNKKYLINNMNKFFAFKGVEAFFVWLVCNTIIVFVIPVVIELTINLDTITINEDYGIIQRILSMLLFIIGSLGISYLISKFIRKKMHSILL